jgi:hypothetical protein
MKYLMLQRAGKKVGGTLLQCYINQTCEGENYNNIVYRFTIKFFRSGYPKEKFSILKIMEIV